MEQQLCVLLYSKYSQNSKRFLDLVKTSSVDFTNTVQLNPLCIDNKKVRSKVLGSKKLEIKTVPCVLITYPDGGVEKYEGGTAFKWVEDIITQLTPPPPPPPPPSLPSPSPSPEPVPKSKKKVSKSRARLPEQSTNIDDLVSEEEESSEEDVREEFMGQNRGGSIRSGQGSYDVQGDFGEMDEPNRSVSRGIKSSTEPGTSAKGSLMAEAMAMQKMRENEEKQVSRNPTNN